MSEFTNGVLFLTREAERAARELARTELPHQVRPLNDTWSAALFPDFDEAAAEAVRPVSEQIPLLYFWHAADHGWGYTVLHEGRVQALVEVSFELLFNGAVAIFEEAYPGKDPFDRKGNPRPEFEALLTVLEESPEYIQAVREQYEEAHPEAMALFDIPADTVERLAAVLSPEYGAGHGEQVEAFKQLLGIEAISWLRYDSAGG